MAETSHFKCCKDNLCLLQIDNTLIIYYFMAIIAYLLFAQGVTSFYLIHIIIIPYY